MAKKTQLVRDLRKLLDGTHPVGTRLPPERTLCASLGVSRTLLRAALGELEAEGRLWRHVGQGTFVGGRPLASDRALALASAVTSPADVMEVRLATEPQLAFHAAMRATESDRAHLRHCLAKLERSPNHANYARWDSTFHRAIAEAAHNALFLMLFDAVNAVRNQQAWSDVWERMITPNRKLYDKQHGQMLEAILARDPHRARELMRQHLQFVRDAIADPDVQPKMTAARARPATVR